MRSILEVCVRTAVAAACLLLIGCSDDGVPDAPEASLPDDVADANVPAGMVRYDDGRVAFDYPEEWRIVEEGGPDEYRVRIVLGDEPDDGSLPDAAIVAFWPFVGNWSLDAAVGRLGIEEGDEGGVEDVTEDEIGVPGAAEAIRQDYRVADTSTGLGPPEPARFGTVIAMGETGRSFFLLVGGLEDADVDLDAVVEQVIGSLELDPEWTS